MTRPREGHCVEPARELLRTAKYSVGSQVSGQPPQGRI